MNIQGNQPGINQSGSYIGVGVNYGSVEQATGAIINDKSRKNLAEAAAEIQELLKQLEQKYPMTTTSEKMVVAAKAVDQIESNPLLKQRVINAIKEGSLAAFEKAIDNPVGAFVIHAIQGWQEVGKD